LKNLLAAAGKHQASLKVRKTCGSGLAREGASTFNP